MRAMMSDREARILHTAPHWDRSNNAEVATLRRYAAGDAVHEARAILEMAEGGEWDGPRIPAYKVCWPSGCNLAVAQAAIMASAEPVLALAESIARADAAPDFEQYIREMQTQAIEEGAFDNA